MDATGGIARRPVDLMVAVIGGALLVMVLLAIALAAEPSAVGDPAELRSLLPPSLFGLAAGLANLAVLLLGGVIVAERLIRRDIRHVVRVLTAAGAGYGTTVALNLGFAALLGAETPTILNASAGGPASNPLHAYLAAAFAYLHATRPVHLPRVTGPMAVSVAVTAASVLLSGYTTALALLLTLLVGAGCASLTNYAIGVSTPRLAVGRLLYELERLGWEPSRLAFAGTDSEGNRCFMAETATRRLQVTVLDSDPTSGVVRRLFSRIVLRNAAAPPLLWSLRDRVEHTALLEYAAAAAGAATPRLLAVGELGPSAAFLVREHVAVRPLTELGDSELTDEFVDKVWAQLRLLHRHRVAHRGISPGTVVQRADGHAAFTALSTGSIAAGPWALSLDQAALLVT